MLFKLARRGVVTWAIEVAALLLLARVVPGVHITSVATSALAVLIIGALNALVRPVVILLAENLGMAFFTVIALVVNAITVLLASAILPGFMVDGLGSAFIVAFGLAVLNTAVSSMLGINDDDSFYRNVIRWLERRRAPATDLQRAGAILIQIDGLAEPIVRSEIESGGLPTLAGWLEQGTHRLSAWECDVPSMTSSGQSGILYGNNANIPAFRWYEKHVGRLIVSNHPRDALLIDQWQATADGLLRDHGSSVGNILSGSAEHCVITMSRLISESGRITARTQDLYDYFVSPYNLYRALGAMLWEVVIELWEAWRQRIRHAEPRMYRGGIYPLVRAITTVLLRDITTWMLVADMFAGRRVAYADYLGYDEVAHHSGPSTTDARRVLRKIDNQLRQIQNAARTAPRSYQLVVLSDHGQSTGATFRQRYGVTLDQLVHQLIEPGWNVSMSSGNGEGVGQVRALISDVVHAGGLIGRNFRRLVHLAAGPRASEIEPALSEHARVEGADVVVCASGNLALVYFANMPGRISLERIEEAHPGLLAGVVQHPGIGFVMVLSESASGPVVINSRGRRDLGDDRVTGEDPLSGFSPHTAGFLRRMSTYANCGDIVVNSECDVGTSQVAAFEELIGCHGGAGGPQTRPFVVYPSEWGDAPTILGSEQLHKFLSQHLYADSHDVVSDSRASTGR